MHADVLQHLTGAALAHRDHRGAAEAVAHHGLHGRVLEWPADRVDHDRHLVLVRQHDLAQKICASPSNRMPPPPRMSRSRR